MVPTLFRGRREQHDIWFCDRNIWFWTDVGQKQLSLLNNAAKQSASTQGNNQHVSATIHLFLPLTLNLLSSHEQADWFGSAPMDLQSCHQSKNELYFGRFDLHKDLQTSLWTRFEFTVSTCNASLVTLKFREEQRTFSCSIFPHFLTENRQSGAAAKVSWIVVVTLTQAHRKNWLCALLK